MELYKRIRLRREELNMSQEELARLLGYKDRSTIAKIEAGKNDITQSKIAAFAKALNTTPSDLMGWDNGSSQESSPDLYDIAKGKVLRDEIIKPYSSLPDEKKDIVIDVAKALQTDNIIPIPQMKTWGIIGATACGQPIHRETYDETILAPSDIHADIVFRCQGDSMIGARIMDGDAVFIRIQPEVENGQIAVVRVADEYTLKRVYQEKDCVELRSENPKYRPIVLRGSALDDFEVVGLAVCFISEVV